MIQFCVGSQGCGRAAGFHFGGGTAQSVASMTTAASNLISTYQFRGSFCSEGSADVQWHSDSGLRGFCCDSSLEEPPCTRALMTFLGALTVRCRAR